MELTVDLQGNGDFKSIQAAVDHASKTREGTVTLYVEPGVYKEKIRIERNRVRLIGKGKRAEETLMTYDDYASQPGPDGEPIGTFKTASVWVGGDDFYAENITVENPANKGQCVALSVEGDRAIFYRVTLLGNQDTLYTPGEGRQYYKDCTIEGTTDFVFGSATAVFEDCMLHSRNVRYVTAASTPEHQPYGYVFIRCQLTGEAAPNSVFLGRPWRPYAHVAFLHCWMGEHILPIGWHNWRKKENEQTARYAEYGSTGPGANTTERADWTKQLTETEAEHYTIDKIFARDDGWLPQIES